MTGRAWEAVSMPSLSHTSDSHKVYYGIYYIKVISDRYVQQPIK